MYKVTTALSLHVTSQLSRALTFWIFFTFYDFPLNIKLFHFIQNCLNLYQVVSHRHFRQSHCSAALSLFVTRQSSRAMMFEIFPTLYKVASLYIKLCHKTKLFHFIQSCFTLYSFFSTVHKNVT